VNVILVSVDILWTRSSNSACDNTILPLATPIVDKDGNEQKELFIPNGTNIIISIVGINRDPTIWGDDAEEWKPERWLSPLPSSVTDARVPSVFGNM